jgi:hypothetical protein
LKIIEILKKIKVDVDLRRNCGDSQDGDGRRTIHPEAENGDGDVEHFRC